MAKYLLQKGDKVAATSRKLSSIEKKLGKESENFLPLELTFDTSKCGIAKKSQANLDAIFKNGADLIILSITQDMDFWALLRK